MCAHASFSECGNSPKGVCDESSQEMTLSHFIIDAPHIKSTKKDHVVFSRVGGGAGGGRPRSTLVTQTLFLAWVRESPLPLAAICC